MRRLVIVVLALVLVPIAEIAVLIAVGQVIGLPLTLLLMLATSAFGGWLLRHQGTRAWRTFTADLAADRPPGPAATDGVLVLIGGVFMLVPGFISDLIGLFFLMPPTRRLSRAFVLRTLTQRISPAASTSLFGPRRVRARAGDPRWNPPTPPSGPGSDQAIEGEIVDR